MSIEKILIPSYHTEIVLCNLRPKFAAQMDWPGNIVAVLGHLLHVNKDYVA